MINAEQFLKAANQGRAGLYTGVPCSFLTPLINAAIEADQLQFVAAVNEGDAVAIACGAELGGLRGVVLMQNSGLGNAVNPLTSLAQTFAVPLLLLITWRGQPGKIEDEPQHELMGSITCKLLDQMRIPWEPFPPTNDAIPAVLGRAHDYMESQSRPYALVVSKGCVSPRGLHPQNHPLRPASAPRHAEPVRETAGRLTQDDVLDSIQQSVSSHDAVLATTGFTGRALYALGDRPNQLYMVGSMGCVLGLALGVALAQPQRRVVAIDGDGALMMRLGTLATVGHYRPPNLLHVLLDNGVHDSTGGQATNSASVDFVAAARACGYPQAMSVAHLSAMQSAVRDTAPGPRLVHVPTSPRSDRQLPRPRITPPEIATRFRNWLKATDSIAPA